MINPLQVAQRCDERQIVAKADHFGRDGCATVDAFQHWIYTHPGHTRAERTAAWLGLMERFGGAVDWSGYEFARANLWHRQLHIFLYPFYYIEYGIAQPGALQVWANSKRDKVRALKDYKRSLVLGGSRPLPEYHSRRLQISIQQENHGAAGKAGTRGTGQTEG